MGIKLKDLDTIRILLPDPLMRELKFTDDLGFRYLESVHLA